MSTARRLSTPDAAPAVVFDTRLLLGALLSGDARGQRLRQSWQLGRCQALVDPASARALMLALACPLLGLSTTQQHELLADYLPYAQVLPAEAARAARTARLPAFEQLALSLAQGARGRVLVSDSRALRARVARSGKPDFKLLGSEEFLAALRV
ncbi:hypothetical protein OOZ63_11545 [Paucibacter sp. PLA-PC-4]|uniref:hypothetical protein n=1 Tax=Paucibacter sp. PLA-PC-4 TaxID=2993655 RepID=UPI0022491738|nr:hypothetical protein [Paucibacter sp. PLA-PC-4]MCX2862475.1 hypothetical protein [Paucibacter sp. PLA-PC-4]